MNVVSGAGNPVDLIQQPLGPGQYRAAADRVNGRRQVRIQHRDGAVRSRDSQILRIGGADEVEALLLQSAVAANANQAPK